MGETQLKGSSANFRVLFVDAYNSAERPPEDSRLKAFDSSAFEPVAQRHHNQHAIKHTVSSANGVELEKETMNPVVNKKMVVNNLLVKAKERSSSAIQIHERHMSGDNLTRVAEDNFGSYGISKGSVPRCLSASLFPDDGNNNCNARPSAAQPTHSNASSVVNINSADLENKCLVDMSSNSSSSHRSERRSRKPHTNHGDMSSGTNGNKLSVKLGEKLGEKLVSSLRHGTQISYQMVDETEISRSASPFVGDDSDKLSQANNLTSTVNFSVA